jgi:hypothetical protein
MENSEWNLIFHEYATLVKEKLQADERSSAISDYVQLREVRIQELSDWQIALLLQWKSRALDSLSPLRNCREKRILKSIPSLFLERIPTIANGPIDENII